MDAFEMTEKLRTRANVSYEEAKAALEANEWDMLDALVYLENRRDGQQAGAAAEKTKKQKEQARQAFYAEAEYTTRTQQAKKRVAVEASPRGFISRLAGFLRDMIRKGNKTYFEVFYRGSLYVELPLTALVPLMLWAFRLMLWVLLIGLFLGAKYRIEGESVEGGANRMMDSAARSVEDARYGFFDDEE